MSKQLKGNKEPKKKPLLTAKQKKLIKHARKHPDLNLIASI